MEKPIDTHAPLAVRMRPTTLDEFVGQEEVLGEGTLLRRAILADRLSSLILYGPPGSGKTTLAHVIAHATHAHFERLNAVLAKVEDLRRVTKAAEARLPQERTILFVDEIHRFNKAQQDALLPHVEEGTVIFIGATTQNPFFSVIAPLVSRSMVIPLKTLSPQHIETILKRSLVNKEKGLGNDTIVMEPTALDHLVEGSHGDARIALNALEIGVLTTPPGEDGAIHFTPDVAEASLQKKVVVYDRDGDTHYDTISAFIKSMRGSDPDAAIYWLAKMLVAGEDPAFIARRIVICAAEDVGNADPMALVLASSALQAVEFVGMPEARIPLAQATTYIACAPKSNASYLAINQAMQEIETKPPLEVPTPLKDAHYRGAKQLGHGKGYKYAHDYPHALVEQAYLPEKRAYYQPTDRGYEAKIKARLAEFERLIHEPTRACNATTK